MHTGAGTLAAEWPLIGRDDELARIGLAREQEDCRGIVVSAGPGVGKSRLAREARAVAERSGARTNWVQATRSAAAVPLGAFAGVLPDEVRSDDALELLRRSAEALREQAAARPVIVAVDDAQMLDPVSAALVLHLALTGSAFVLATVRTGEPCPDAIVSLWKDAGARRIELGTLSDEAVATLVQTALGGPVEQAVLAWVAEQSRGNALFARELVLGAVASGTLALKRGLWRLTRVPTVSATLVELVAERMQGLSDAEREALELLALGEPLKLTELGDLSSFDVLTTLEAQGMISATEGVGEPQVRLAHPLHGEGLRAELPIVRAHRLRLKLAAVLEQRAPLTPDDALRIARLRLDAGAEIPAALLVDAARAAILSGDPDLGAHLAQRADGLPAALLLARAHTVRKRFDEAESTLAALEPVLAIDYLEQRTHVLFWGLNRPNEARALLDRAHGWSEDADWHARVEPLRLGFSPDVGGTVESLEQVAADPSLDAVTRRMSERRLAVSLFFTGRTADARALAERLKPEIPLRNYSDALALGIRRLIGIESGEDWAALDADMGQVLRDGVRAHDDEAAGHGALGLGYTELLRGRYRDAERWFAEAELHFERQDTFGNLIHVRALQVGAAHFGGQPEAALAAHERLLATLDGREALSSQAPYVARAEGWTLLARGDVTGARATFLAAADLLAYMPGYAAQLRYEALRAGATATQIADALAPLVERCDARLVAAYLAHARSLAEKDGAALLDVARELAAIGADRYALEAAVDAATVFRDAGRQDSARRAAALARELHAPGHGTEPPFVDGLGAASAGLTAREAQLVELASRGLSNAEIADRLVLSVRTVESHIYRAMQKLGVNDRRDLRA
ncbi:LuxR C-terminal-related transcriptional regulator [Solirubrobacter phytolaccae]|uniref:LuxR C-terminal-related transcriptional regulator n=1 Tax=Solirubrobacter phytolaccae TaxID=1404360 RepID=A0A9X3NE39_9ACTN|nr:LuxR family transcriptional regulator [Solirubrobacter phytolaccae]MDA0185005.1 LuxR C-terminal-related transcriptional regulator [Solirubrobacter phytolaccae]